MLNVFLGYSCNLKCGYCLQAPMAQRSRKVKPDAKKFIDKVLPWVIEKDIRQIAYWGGEPLVYWSAIEEIHNEFIRCGHKFDNIKLATNGTLFTKKHVDQCNEWGVYTIISQHPEFGTPAWDQVVGIERMSLSYLFYHNNLYAWPWIEEVSSLEQRYQRTFHPFMHWTRSTEGADHSTDLTHKDLDEHILHLWDIAAMAKAGDRHARNLWMPHLLEWKDKLDPSTVAVPMCYGDHQIDIDIEGNRYGCHHTVEPWIKTGTIWEDDKESAAFKQVHKFIDTEECQQCPIKTWCRGNCHLSRTHDVDCRLSKYKHKILSWLDLNMEVGDERIYRHD